MGLENNIFKEIEYSVASSHCDQIDISRYAALGLKPLKLTNPSKFDLINLN